MSYLLASGAQYIKSQRGKKTPNPRLKPTPKAPSANQVFRFGALCIYSKVLMSVLGLGLAAIVGQTVKNTRSIYVFVWRVALKHIVFIMAALILLVACNTRPTTRPLTSCKIDRFDEGKYESVILQGAAIVLERKGGEKCVDETFTIYPDGRIVGNNGKATIGKAVSPAELNALLARTDDLGWFRDDMFSSWHDNICSACYAYLMIVSYQDRVKP